MDTDELADPRYGPLDHIRPRHYHDHRKESMNGSAKIIWAALIGSLTINAAIGSIIFVKVFDVDNRLTRVETLLEVIAKKDGVLQP